MLISRALVLCPCHQEQGSGCSTQPQLRSNGENLLSPSLNPFNAVIKADRTIQKEGLKEPLSLGIPAIRLWPIYACYQICIFIFTKN